MLNISKLEEKYLLESQRLVYKNINFIDEAQIPKDYRLKAYELVNDIDFNDIVFVALNEFQESILWTGDKVLMKGLKAKDYKRIISTEELVQLRNKLDKKN